MHRPIRVVARLASPLAGGPPMLDALLECLLAPSSPAGLPRHGVDPSLPAPPPGLVPIPLAREEVGGQLVARCSSPIEAPAAAEAVEHVVKKVEVGLAGLLAPASRGVVATSAGWTKSYRVPLRVRVVPAVAWLAVGDPAAAREALAGCVAIGKKVAAGYGRVAAWEVAEVAEDWSWFAPGPAGPVLMRPLPDGPWLPAGLAGARPDFGACAPPYWHPDRHGEVVVPCG